MRIALAQIDTTVGDFAGNVERIRAAARGVEADLVLFPELSVCGYMPRDLLCEPSFLQQCRDTLEELAQDRSLPPLLVGAPLAAASGGRLYNAAVLVQDGKVRPILKGLLPNYDVFDEKRYFRGAKGSEPITIGPCRVGVTICEDAWAGAYARDPVAELVDAGAEIIVNISASPYERNKAAYRLDLIAGHARRHGVPMALCNLVGGNDQLLFDGSSLAVDAKGRLCVHAPPFREGVVVTDFSERASPPLGLDDLNEAITLGLGDYFRKTGFSRAILGMSGGIDSSLVACLAARALGRENVTGVAMPGPYNAPESLECARTLAQNLGIHFSVVPIDEAFALTRKSLFAVWGAMPADRTEENLQARLRGLFLMAFANKSNGLVVVPSNKSEMAMGYCTLYGDMVGALAPIADLYKGEVYELARAFDDVIPALVFERPPSAELRPDQTDQDTLPPYEQLDEILRLHLEARRSPAEIAAEGGFDRALVERVLKTVAANEYKRQQGAPVIKVSSKAFGYGRRFPIVERFRGGTV
ncbi:MAG: NAD+ synthase [Planctomycetota bacterium]|nr:NAD+ synthase [Planctomycetota bacterium]